MERDVRGARIFFLDEGAGAPLFFLHGNPDSAELWRGVIDGLNQKYRCIAPDLPGFGRSETIPGLGHGFDSLGEVTDALIDAAGIDEPVTLVAHDFGGPFAIAWALKKRERVRALVLSNTLNAGYQWHFWARIWRTRILGELSMLAQNRWAFRRVMRDSAPRLSIAHIDATYDRITPLMRRTVLALYRATDPGSTTWRDCALGLRAFAKDVPVLVLWGDEDPFIDPHFAESFGAGTVRHFPDNGHFLPVEAPNAFAACLDAFLDNPKVVA